MRVSRCVKAPQLPSSLSRSQSGELFIPACEEGKICPSWLCIHSQGIFALSQLTLKVKGQRRPVMLQKDPRDTLTPSASPPLCERRSEHCSRPLAFAESCTAMRSLCLLPLSSPPLPPPLPWLARSFLSLPPIHISLLPWLSPSISTPLLNFQSHNGAEDIPPFPSFPPSSAHSLSLLLQSKPTSSLSGPSPAAPRLSCRRSRRLLALRIFLPSNPRAI